MPEVGTTTLWARNDLGRFLAECRLAGEHTMADVAKEGKELAQSLAPRGHKADPRTVSIADGMFSRSTGNTATWGSTARHTLAQEHGGRPHPITGQVRFWWEKMGRMWSPGFNMISHPGNPARPFLRPSYEIMVRRWSDIARRYYPH